MKKIHTEQSLDWNIYICARCHNKIALSIAGECQCLRCLKAMTQMPYGEAKRLQVGLAKPKKPVQVELDF